MAIEIPVTGGNNATVSGNVFTLGTVLSGFIDIGKAVAWSKNGDLTVDGSLDGAVATYRAEYPDTTIDDDFEIFEATYDSAGTLTRTRTLFGKDGATYSTSATVFSGAIVVYAVITNEHVPSLDGWIERSLETWSFASSTTFTIAGVDVTSEFPVGTKIKLTNDFTTKYFYVVGATFSTDTTVTITGGDDYALVSGSITDKYISHSATPEDFPQWFNFSPSYSNLTVGNGTSVAKFRLEGSAMFIDAYFTMGSTSSISGAVVLTLPITNANHRKYRGVGVCSFLNSGTAIQTGVVHTDSTTTLALVVTGTSGSYDKMYSLSATIPFTWTTSDGFMFSTSGIKI